MLKYENMGNGAIFIPLKNGYDVIAFFKWNKAQVKYNVSLYLRGDTYDTLELIEEKEKVEINADIKTIKVKIAKMITSLLEDGFFTHYIQRYEYMMKCFEKGNEFFEQRGENV